MPFLPAAGFHLRSFDLGVLVRGPDEDLPARPAEDQHDEHEGEAHVDRGRDELLGERVGRRGVGVGVVLQRDDVGRLRDPDGAGRHGSHVRCRARADHAHHRVERDGDRVGGQEHADHADLRGVAADLGQQHARRERPWGGEDLTALLRLLPRLLEPAPEDPHHEHDQEGAADEEQQRQHAVVTEPAELDVERLAGLEEQVQVHEAADDREEDLVDHVGGQDPRERRAGDDRHEHQQRHERPDVGGQEVVHRHADRVGRDDLPQLHAAGVGVGEDPVVGEPVKRRLQHLQHTAEHQVLDGDVLDLRPDVIEPADDIDAEQPQDDQEHEQAYDPAADLDEPPLARRIAERRDRLDGASHGVDELCSRSRSTWGCGKCPSCELGPGLVSSPGWLQHDTTAAGVTHPGGDRLRCVRSRRHPSGRDVAEHGVSSRS